MSSAPALGLPYAAPRARAPVCRPTGCLPLPSAPAARRGVGTGTVGGTAYPAVVDPDLLTWIAGGVAVLALLLALAAWQRLRVVDRRLQQLVSTGAPTTPQGERLDALEADVAAVRSDLAQALRHVAVVRYDAFGDMGGRMSFSAAVVDDTGDGMVISSIHARGESRTYAKGIVGGDSEIVLTPEERQALDAARTGQDG